MMKNTLLTGLLCFLMASSLPAQSGSEIPTLTRTYVLKNVNIIPRPGEMIEMGAVVVKDGLIQAVGKDLDIPFDAKVLETDSMYVYAGFIDGLSFLGMPKEQNEEGRPEVEDPGNPPNALAGIQPQRQARDLFDPSEKMVGEFRKLGFTTAHVVPQEGVFPGKGALVLLGSGSAHQLMLRDETALFSQLDGAGSVFPATLMGVMSKWRELYQQARQAQMHLRQYARGPKGMARPEYDIALEAFFPVLDQQQTVFFRAPGAKEAFRVLDLQEELGFPLALGDLRQGWRVLDEVRDKDVPVFLTLELPDPPKEEEEKEKKNEMLEEIKELEKRRQTTMEKYEGQAARFAEAGAAFGFSTIDAKTKDIRANLRRMVAAGLSEDQALAALTTAPAQLLGLSEMMGTVEAGKIANLVVTSKPYFEKQSKVNFVMVDGELFKYLAEPGAKADPAALARVVGEWNYTIDIPGQATDGTLTLVDQGGVLGGTLKNSQSPESVDIQGAQIKDDELRFTTNFDAGGQSIRLIFNLTLDGDAFEGKVQAGNFGSFDIDGEKISGTPDDRW